MEANWKGHTLRVTGRWTARWLFLAPDYELWLDERCIDRAGGPLVRPRLEAVVEDDDGALHHVEAHLVSIVGWKPLCELSVEGELVASDRVRVDNFLNPFLILFILVCTAVMLYVGPEVLRRHL